jgi:hypothetical protein
MGKQLAGRVTGWVGASRFASVPIAASGLVLLPTALAYLALERSIIAADGPGSRQGAAVDR